MKNSKIITIDGPSGVGKGTLAKNLAHELDWIVLDSGSLYRMIGYLSLHLNTRDFYKIKEKINIEADLVSKSALRKLEKIGGSIQLKK